MIINMPYGINPLTFALGHQWGYFNPQKAHIGENLNMRANIAKALGYIPGVSMIVGIFRIIGLFEKEQFKDLYPILALHDGKEEDAITIRIALRAIFEILSMTLILLLLDVIADLIRLQSHEQNSK